MKRLLEPFGNFILVLTAVVCTMGAVISAFDFQVSWFILILLWAIVALATVSIISFLRIRLFFAILIPFAVIVLFLLPEILAGARWSIFYITTEFNRWLFLSVFFEDTQIYGNELTTFFFALGAAMTFLLTLVICLRRSALLTVLLTLPFVALSFVIIFNQSAPGFLLGLVAVYLAMILSSGLAPDSFSGRGKSTFVSLLLVAVLMLITLVFAPPQNYARGNFVRIVDQQIRDAATRAGIARIRTGIGWPVRHGDTWAFNTDTVNISESGTRNIYDFGILEVTVSAPGVFYLRGYSMQYFDGSNWTVNCDDVLDPQDHFVTRSSPASIAELHSAVFPENAPELVHMSVSVTGDSSRDITYIPYFADPIEHTLSPYDFKFPYIQESILQLKYELAPHIDVAHLLRFYNSNTFINSSDTYLQVEDSTAEALRQFAAERGIIANAPREIIASQVATFMTGFGTYTLSPFIVPLDEDFVMYFLEVSQHGFCIHYATAATLMLRALDVPARFTSGFVVTAREHEVGEPINITDRYAHAWVEVFFDDVGWLPIEVTPPATGFGFSDGRLGPGIGTVSTSEHNWYDEPDFVDWWAELEQGFDADPDFVPPVRDSVYESYSPITQVVLVGLIVLLVICAPVTYRFIMMHMRSKRFTMDDTNMSVVFAWRYLEKLERFKTDSKIPNDVEDIAMKARYSQHSISENERLSVITYVTGFAEIVYTDNNGFKLFRIKYVRGL